MFRNAKIGDRVWSVIDDWGTVVKVDNLISVRFDREEGDYWVQKFQLDGKETPVDIYPTLYWDKVKFEIPKKPFDLKKELSQIKRKKFVMYEDNIFFMWDNAREEICLQNYKKEEIPNVLYYDRNSALDFLEILDDRKITKEEFFKATTELYLESLKCQEK